MFLGSSNFLEEISILLLISILFCSILLFPLYYFLLFLCIVLLRRLSYLSLLFSEALHSDAYIFPFRLCFSLLFFSQLFVRPPQTTILPFCISFSWGWFRVQNTGTWVQSQKLQNDLCLFLKQTIQYYSNPSLCPNH